MRPPEISWRVLLPLLALGLIFSLPRLLLATEPAPPSGLAAPAQPAALPSFELPNAQGGTTRSADLQGKVVLVRFWATW